MSCEQQDSREKRIAEYERGKVAQKAVIETNAPILSEYLNSPRGEEALARLARKRLIIALGQVSLPSCGVSEWVTRYFIDGEGLAESLEFDFSSRERSFRYPRRIFQPLIKRLSADIVIKALAEELETDRLEEIEKLVQNTLFELHEQASLERDFRRTGSEEED